MILLVVFLSLWLGLVCKTNYVIFILLILLFLLFVIYRFSKGKMIAVVGAVFVVFGVGISHIRISTDREEMKGVVVESKENYYILNSSGEKFYAYEKNNDKEVGDWIYIKGIQEELDFVTLESEFDFKDYLNKKGVYKKFNIDYSKSLFRNPIRIKNVREKFLNHFEENTKDLYSSILFSTSLNGDLTKSLRNINLSRLISFSGIYIYFFISFIEKILNKFLKEKTSSIVSTSILSFYSIFTFPRFTVIKILFIRILRLINKYKLNNKFSSGTIIAFSGIIFLLLNHRLANQDAFILGYLISLNNLFLNSLCIKKKGIKRRLFTLLWLYFFFIPFELKFNNSTNFISFFSQILIAPLFMISAFLGFLCFFKVPIYAICNIYTNIIIFVSKALGIITFSVNFPQMNAPLILIYYCCYYLIMYYSQIKFLPIIKALKYIYISLIVLYISPIKNFISCEVSFINVGQGDCCLIRDGNDTILIDTGGLTYKDLATSSLIPYFKSKRLYNIDLVIITHDDYDHCGALTSLRNNFKVKNVIISHQAFPVGIGKMNFVNYNIFSENSEEENDNSLVIGFSLMNKNFLITGDAPIEIENKIMETYENIPCDILKVGHHGSKTSTSHKFLNFLNPKEAVISVGKNNKFGHPNDSVINILKNNNVIIKRTDILGTITYSNYKFL